ncbi:MAG: YcjF family protein [Isosphaeraceae bacterium]
MVEDAGHGASNAFQVVVMGTGPVGKTSLINAMLGRSVGETGATMGTTRGGRVHTHVVQGVEGALLLTDTPGLGEAGSEGWAREAEAIDLATCADLLVFVVDQDLTRADTRNVFELAQRGKRLIVALNKKDRFTEEDREAIMAKLRERLEGFVPVEDIVAVAAAPAPVQVRVRKADGTAETVLEEDPPDLEALEGRVAAVLSREGDALRAGNLLLRARIREQAERERIARERRTRAATIVDRHQWLAAVTAFANPVLALGPMAVGAVQFRMLSEMAAVYGVQLTSEFVEKVGHQMAQTLMKLGVAEAAASVLAGFFKFNPLGFAAGGLVQAVTMAYLTRLTGDSFLEYLERGQTWGEGGMQETLSRHIEETRRSEWLMEFARMALHRLFRR